MATRIKTPDTQPLKNNETGAERKAQRAEHADRMRELRKEQRELSRTIKTLDRELGVAIKRWESTPTAVRDGIKVSLQNERKKSSMNATEMDFLSNLNQYEHVGVEIKNFLSKPENLLIIALLIGVTPGTGLLVDLIRQHKQTPEMMMALTGVAAGAFTAIGTAIYRLTETFGESQKMVQQEINSLRKILNDWQASSR